MTGIQVFVLAALGITLVIVVAVAILMLVAPGSGDSPATIPAATVPPNPLLVTRAPLCQQFIVTALAQEGWASAATLDPQRASLEIRLDAPPAGPDDPLPADQIWMAFEVAVAGQEQGCSGYTDLIVLVAGYRAQVAANDLLAWGSGELDDGVLSGRVVLTR